MLRERGQIVERSGFVSVANRKNREILAGVSRVAPRKSDRHRQPTNSRRRYFVVRSPSAPNGSLSERSATRCATQMDRFQPSRSSPKTDREKARALESLLTGSTSNREELECRSARAGRTFKTQQSLNLRQRKKKSVVTHLSNSYARSRARVEGWKPRT